MKDISVMKDNQSSVPFGLQIENGDLKLITGSKCVAQNAHLKCPTFEKGLCIPLTGDIHLHFDQSLPDQQRLNPFGKCL